MTTRRARRRSAPRDPQPPLLTRILQWVTGWEGIISLSVVFVLVVLIQGVLRLPLPFGIGEPAPPPDAWGNIGVPRGTSPKIVYVANTADGAPLDAAGGQQAIQFALNERQDIQGTKLEVQAVGDSCDPSAAAAKAQEIARDPAVVGVISQACSASTIELKKVLTDIHVPLFTVNETSPSLTTGGTQSVFRLTGNQVIQAKTGVFFAREELGATRALVLYEDLADMSVVADSFRTQFRAQAGNILDSRPLAPDRQWDGILKEIAVLQPDLIYLVSRGKLAGDFLTAIRAGGYAGNFMVTDTAYQDAGYLLAGPVLEGTFATTLQVPRADKYAFWKTDFEKEYLAVGPLSAEAYDAASILLQSLSIAARTGRNGTFEVGKQRLAGVISSIPYNGVTGVPAFDANGDRANVLIPVMKFEGGAFRQVK